MKNKLKYLPTLLLTFITVSSSMALAGSGASADTTGSKSAVVNVAAACAITSNESYTTNLSSSTGTTITTEGSGSGRVAFSAACSDAGGFSILAVGFSPDGTHPDGLEGNTGLYGSAGTIPTGTTGAGSRWAFKVSSATSTTSYQIQSPYSSYAAIPGTATPVVSYAGAASGTQVTGTLRTDYQIQLAGSQPQGAYTGAVKYTLAVNP